MRNLFQRLLALLCTAVLLSACGSHDDEPPLVLSTILNGDEVIPRNQSTALASGTVTIDWEDDNVLLATVFSADVTPTAVHLHAAPPSNLGLIVLALERVAFGPVWQGSVSLTDEQIRELNHGNYYLDLHTLAFPSGELRGQLFSAFPPQEHISALNSVASQSPLVEEQLRQLDDFEDWWHDGHSWVGFGLTFGF